MNKISKKERLRFKKAKTRERRLMRERDRLEMTGFQLFRYIVYLLLFVALTTIMIKTVK